MPEVRSSRVRSWYNSVNGFRPKGRGLENRRAGSTGPVGSNPTPSAESGQSPASGRFRGPDVDPYGRVSRRQRTSAEAPFRCHAVAMGVATNRRMSTPGSDDGQAPQRKSANARFAGRSDSPVSPGRDAWSSSGAQARRPSGRTIAPGRKASVRPAAGRGEWSSAKQSPAGSAAASSLCAETIAPVGAESDGRPSRDRGWRDTGV